MVNLQSYLIRAVLLVYSLPLVISIAIGLLLVFVPSPLSAPQCIYSPSSPTLYYSLTSLAYLFPNLLTALINLGYLFKYLRSEYAHFNWFLTFPILQILGSVYYLFVAGWRVVTGGPPFEWSEVPILCLPMVYVVAFWGMVVARLRCGEDEAERDSIDSRKPRDNSIEFTDRSWSDKSGKKQ